MSLVPVEEQEEGTWIYLDGNHPNKQDAFASEEVWARREAARMRQIAIGKARPEYRRYVAEVPFHQREPADPSTPNPKDRVSKRQFDRALGDWRRRLHEYDAGHEEPRSSSEGPVQPGAMNRSFLGGESLPRHAGPPPKSPPRPETVGSALPQVSPSPVPQPPMDGGVVRLHLADQLPAPHATGQHVPSTQAQAEAAPHGAHVDFASAAAIGIAAAVTALTWQRQTTWPCDMLCDSSMMYVPHVEAANPMCDPRFMAQPPMMPSSAAPETPLRPQRGPVHMDDGETPPPVCPFWTQAAETFVPASGPTLGAVSEECERGTKLTYEDALSPTRKSQLTIPKEPMTPMTPPRTSRVPCSPSSVIQTPCPGWVVETPSPTSWMSRADFGGYPAY